MSAWDPRQQALTSTGWHAQLCATLYVGDQLARIADVLEHGFALDRVVRYQSGRTEWSRDAKVRPLPPEPPV